MMRMVIGIAIGVLRVVVIHIVTIPVVLSVTVIVSEIKRSGWDYLKEVI